MRFRKVPAGFLGDVFRVREIVLDWRHFELPSGNEDHRCCWSFQANGGLGSGDVLFSRMAWKFGFELKVHYPDFLPLCLATVVLGETLTWVVYQEELCEEVDQRQQMLQDVFFFTQRF